MHLSPRSIDLRHLVQNSHVDAILLPECFRATDNELFFRVDNPADVIRDTSGGKGGVGAPLEDNDIQLGTTTPCLGSGAHSSSIAADNDQSFFCHKCSSCQNTELHFAPCVRLFQPGLDHVPVNIFEKRLDIIGQFQTVNEHEIKFKEIHDI